MDNDRWVRSEGCRNAISLADGAMFLIELPVEEPSTLQAIPGDGRIPSPLCPPPRGWFVRVEARNLRSMSVPMSPEEVWLWTEGRQSSRWLSAAAVPSTSELVLVVGGGRCAWLQFEDASNRDALLRRLEAWYSAVTGGATLSIIYTPRPEAERCFRVSQTGAFRSLMNDRKAWEFGPVTE